MGSCLLRPLSGGRTLGGVISSQTPRGSILDSAVQAHISQLEPRRKNQIGVIPTALCHKTSTNANPGPAHLGPRRPVAGRRGRDEILALPQRVARPEDGARRQGLRVEAVGHRETPGRPALYATTKAFLADLGLRSLAELPPLAELDSSHPMEMPDAPTKAAAAPLALASPLIGTDSAAEPGAERQKP